MVRAGDSTCESKPRLSCGSLRSKMSSQVRADTENPPQQEPAQYDRPQMKISRPSFRSLKMSAANSSAASSTQATPKDNIVKKPSNCQDKQEPASARNNNPTSDASDASNANKKPATPSKSKPTSRESFLHPVTLSTRHAASRDTSEQVLLRHDLARDTADVACVSLNIPSEPCRDVSQVLCPPPKPLRRPIASKKRGVTAHTPDIPFGMQPSIDAEAGAKRPAASHDDAKRSKQQ